MIDHKQCINCKHAYWTVGKGYRPKFTWCNCLDRTGEPHKVVEDVCLSNTALADEQAKAEALRKAREIAVKNYERMKADELHKD